MKTSVATAPHPAPESHENLLLRMNRTEAMLRSNPGAYEHRWALVEQLCQLGHWERALKQLQMWAQIRSDTAKEAHVLRGLIQAEHQRMRVFQGQERAAPVRDFPLWMQYMAQALEHNAQGSVQQADACRTQGLEQAPQLRGSCQWEKQENGQRTRSLAQQSFEWLADSDTRLGPICEVIASGAYRWLAFADIAHVRLKPPQTPLDLVWMPAQLQLQANPDGTAGPKLHVFIPARSCWLKPPQAPTPKEQLLLLGALTVWEDVGETGVFAHGQKTWMSAGFDWPLLDIREINT